MSSAHSIVHSFTFADWQAAAMTILVMLQGYEEELPQHLCVCVAAPESKLHMDA